MEAPHDEKKLFRVFIMLQSGVSGLNWYDMKILFNYCAEQ